MMSTLIYFLLGIVIIGLLTGFIWRISSQRHTLPCPSWLRTLVEMDNPFTETNHASVIIELLNLRPGMKVLDAGCGPGRLALPLAQTVGETGQVTALDIQQEMLDRVRQKAQAANLNNIRYVRAELGKNTLEAGQFDSALLVTVLGEIPNQAAVLSEIYNTLKPGGVLSITEIIFDPHFQSRNKVLQLTQAAGFCEKGFFGKKLAYTMHFEKPVSAA
jgi:ubiquinone/menaquinone biosynthesis C-methylase UbiE